MGSYVHPWIGNDALQARMKIGILCCGHLSDTIAAEFGTYTDLYGAMLAGHGFDIDSFNVVDMEFPDSISQADGWLLTGSRFGVYDQQQFLAPLQDFVRRAYDAHIPLVGICFGHQLIAQALGGRVEKFDGGWQVGRRDYAFDGLGDLSLHAWHQDQVIVTPTSARTIAKTEFCRYAGFRYEGSALSVQPHPEFATPIMRGLIGLRQDEGNYPDGVLDTALSSLAGPVDNSSVAHMLADFLKTQQV